MSDAKTVREILSRNNILKKNDKLTFNFGKYKGHSVIDVAMNDIDYLKWLLITLRRENNKPLLTEAIDEAIQEYSK